MNSCQFANICTSNEQVATIVALIILFAVGLAICEEWHRAKCIQAVVLVGTMMFGASIYLVVNTPPALIKAADARAYNAHWQERVNLHIAVCYQREATIPEVKRCLMNRKVFI